MKNFLKTLGPGILFASTAIGVSHLVQSTRAGANYSFGLLAFILLANLLKFPFFEYGSRYANVARTTLIDGYAQVGKWMLYLYSIITFLSMFFVTAAVMAVTAGFMNNLFQFDTWSPIPNLALYALILGALLILWVGSYGLLDTSIKILGGLLFVSTVTAFIIALFDIPLTTIHWDLPDHLFSDPHLPFVIALMGWMPTAVDLSTWNSMWTLERIHQSSYSPKLSETLFEFNFGYWISAFLSLCFLTLGALILYNQGVEMPNSSSQFAFSIIGLYTNTIGEWSYFIIAVAGFSIMFGTTIGLLDGYARNLERITELVVTKKKGDILANKKQYRISLMLTALGGFLVILLFQHNPKGFKGLIDFATTLSFMIAPIIAAVNFYLVMNKKFPTYGRPGIFMQILSWIGILFLSGFSIFYLWYILN